MTRRELTPADYIAILRRRWVLIAVLAVIGPPLAYGISRFLAPKYTSETVVLVQPPTVSSRFVEPVDVTGISQRLASMQTQILSRTRLEPIIRKFGLYAQDLDRVSMDDLVARLQDAIAVTPVLPMAETRASNLPGFFVKVTLGDPRAAQQVCSAITSMFIEENLRMVQQHSDVTTEFLSQQLADAKKNLDDQDAKFAAFEGRYMGSLPDQEQTNLNILMGLSSQLDAATLALSRAQQDKSVAESTLAQQIAAWKASQTGHDPLTLEEQLAALQAQLPSLQARYTDDYPDVIKAKNDIRSLQEKIAESHAHNNNSGDSDNAKMAGEPLRFTQLRAQIRSYDQVISEKTKEQDKLKEQIKVYEARVQSSPAIEQQYKQLTRGYQTALDSYKDLLKKRDEAAMATDLQRQQQGEQFRVLDPANLPDKPSFPNRPKFALGGLGAGLALGLGLAFLLEMKDTSMRSERDIEFALRLPVLAMVPAIEPLSGKKARQLVGRRRVDSRLRLDART
jgi:polysaccharide chain length determinant protein (PEP-CTERM system associated)